MALTDQVIMPGSDYQAICDATRKLTSKTATLKSGEISTELETVTPQSETWVLGLLPSSSSGATGTFSTIFTSSYYSNMIFYGIKCYAQTNGYKIEFYTNSEKTSTILPYSNGWGNDNIRKLTFKNPPTDAKFLSWLNVWQGEKQNTDLAVCSEDSITIHNTPYVYTPEHPYDGTKKLSITISPTTQATPSISVNADGLITASATQSAGYVSAGTKSATKQLPTQAAKTITPSSSAQTAVPQGRYTTGAVTVAEIPKSYIGPLAPSADCAAILANVSTSAGTLSGTTLSLTRRLSTDGNSNIANKVIKQGDEYVDETSVTVPTEEKTITPTWTVGSSSSDYSPTSGKLIRRVVVNRPSTLISSNIRKGVSICGITGTYAGDDVFIKDVNTIHVTTSEGTITLRTSRLARYLCVRTRSDNRYVASADIRSISSLQTAGESLSLDITSKGSTYDYVWNLFRSDDLYYDGANLTVYIIYN